MNHNLDIFSNNNFLLEQSLDPQAEAEVPTLVAAKVFIVQT